MTAALPTRGRCTDGHQVEVRKKRAVGGGSVYVPQCTVCGKQVGRPVPRAKVLDPRKVPRFDARKAHRPQPTRRKRDYYKHLRSAYWKNLRKRRFAMDNDECQAEVAPGVLCRELATDCAHVTYERFGKERIEDVRSECKAHNQAEREARIRRFVLGPVEA